MYDATLTPFDTLVLEAPIQDYFDVIEEKSLDYICNIFVPPHLFANSARGFVCIHEKHMSYLAMKPKRPQTLQFILQCSISIIQCRLRSLEVEAVAFRLQRLSRVEL